MILDRKDSGQVVNMKPIKSPRLEGAFNILDDSQVKTPSSQF